MKTNQAKSDKNEMVEGDIMAKMEKTDLIKNKTKRKITVQDKS